MSKFLESVNLSVVPYISGGVGAFVGYLYGSESIGILTMLLALIVADYITGLMVGFSTKSLSSNRSYIGLFRKILILILVALGHLLDVYILHTGSMLEQMIIFFFIANEGLSIIENSANLGVPIPAGLRSALIQLKANSESSIDSVKESIATDTAEEILSKENANISEKSLVEKSNSLVEEKTSSDEKSLG